MANVVELRRRHGGYTRLTRAVASGLLLGVLLTGSVVASAAIALAAPSATLQLEPTQGPMGTQLMATYTYTPDAGSPCPRGSIAFTWDGRELLGPAQPLAATVSGCKATLSTRLPATSAQPGAHEVCGTYAPPASAGGPAAPVKACGTFTVIALSPTPALSPAPSPTFTIPTKSPATPSPTATRTETPTATPTSTRTEPPKPTPTATATPTPTTQICTTSALNLVQNPGFEAVSSSPALGPWSVGETATTQVPQWTRANISLYPPVVLNSGVLLVHPAVEGSRFVYLPGYSGSLSSQVQGLVGTLSAATNVGATYLVSAQIATEMFGSLYDSSNLIPPQPSMFELRLRNSGTGAESAPVLQATIGPQTTGWALITGTLTANAAYDQVALRFYQQVGVSTTVGLVDDVRVCQAVIPTPPPTPTNVAIATSKPTPAPTPTPTCVTDAANLVQNPSFEHVSGPGSVPGYYQPNQVAWSMWETDATTKVPYWTTGPSGNANAPVAMVFDNGVNPLAGSVLALMAFQGARYALVPHITLLPPQEIVGTLSTTTNVGATYVLSAGIAGAGYPVLPTLELRLRNSGTGAMSDPVVSASTAHSPNWVLITGTVTANAIYDRVVLRYYQDPAQWYGGGSPMPGFWVGLIDDVHVCQATSAPANPPVWWWTIAGVAGVLVLIGGLGLGIRRWRHTGPTYTTGPIDIDT